MLMQHYRPELYHARSSVGYLLKRAHMLMLDQLEPVVAGSDITITHWIVMMHLRDGLAINASDLCAQLRHDSGALTRLIDQLEARGLVERERSREDRRAVQLRLTAAGLATLSSLLPKVVDRLNFTLREFTRAEANELTRLLTKLITSLEGSSTESGAAA